MNASLISSLYSRAFFPQQEGSFCPFTRRSRANASLIHPVHANTFTPIEYGPTKFSFPKPKKEDKDFCPVSCMPTLVICLPSHRALRAGKPITSLPRLIFYELISTCDDSCEEPSKVSKHGPGRKERVGEREVEIYEIRWWQRKGFPHALSL